MSPMATPRQASKLALAGRRIAAFALDWLVIAAWAGLLFGAVMLAFDGRPPSPGGPWRSQAIGLATMTLPVLLYFTLCESSRWRATPGKRALRLQVVRGDDARPPLARSLLRNLVKFAPWELGHVVANQAAFAAGPAPPAWLWAALVAACAVPAWWIVAILVRGRAPYDAVAGLRVQPAPAA